MEAARRFSPIPFVHRVRRDADGLEDGGSGGVALNFLRVLAGSCGSVFLSTGFAGCTIQTRRNVAVGSHGPRKLFSRGSYAGSFKNPPRLLQPEYGALKIVVGSIPRDVGFPNWEV